MMIRVQRQPTLSMSVVALALLAANGCGRVEGPERHSIRGTVTFKGEPVPLGQIAFEPDTSEGNQGPGGYADIVAGRYVTHMGAVSGPHRVRISGQSGPVVDETQDVTLFTDYVTTADIDAKQPEINFEVPAAAPRQRRRR